MCSIIVSNQEATGKAVMPGTYGAEGHPRQVFLEEGKGRQNRNFISGWDRLFFWCAWRAQKWAKIYPRL